MAIFQPDVSAAEVRGVLPHVTCGVCRHPFHDPVVLMPCEQMVCRRCSAGGVWGAREEAHRHACHVLSHTGFIAPHRHTLALIASLKGQCSECRAAMTLGAFLNASRRGGHACRLDPARYPSLTQRPRAPSSGRATAHSRRGGPRATSPAAAAPSASSSLPFPAHRRRKFYCNHCGNRAPMSRRLNWCGQCDYDLCCDCARTIHGGDGVGECPVGHALGDGTGRSVSRSLVPMRGASAELHDQIADLISNIVVQIIIVVVVLIAAVAIVIAGGLVYLVVLRTLMLFIFSCFIIFPLYLFNAICGPPPPPSDPQPLAVVEHMSPDGTPGSSFDSLSD